MSRIAGLALLLAAVAMPAHADQTTMLANYAKLTTAEPDCRQRADSDEIVVCGRRDADRYRVPLIAYEAGDPRSETLAGERRRLQAITTACDEHRSILVGCGMVGVHVGVSGDGTVMRRRELAR